MKMHKKLKTLLVTAGVISCIGVTTYAVDSLKSITHDSATQSDTVTINATTKMPVEPQYTITIDVGELTKSATTSIKVTTFDVVATDIANLESKKVNVKVSTGSGDFHLTSTKGKKLPYQVFNVASNGTALNSGDPFATFTTNDTVTGRIEIDQKDIPETDAYEGILTFTISVDAI